MAIIFPGDDPIAALACVQSLATDLAQIVADGKPPASALAEAPLIDWWLPARRTLSALTGEFKGHPHIDNGRVGITSDL